MDRPLNARGRHLALVGFMGAGKSTVGPQLAERLGRRFVDLDAEIERQAGLSIAKLFARRGEAHFRSLETERALGSLRASEPAVISLGGGAVTSPRIREALRERAFTVLLDVDVEEAWRRVQGGERPLARDEAGFRALYEERRPLYDDVACGRAQDIDGAVLAAAGIYVERGALARLGALVPGEGPVELAIDATVAELHGAAIRAALGARLGAVHELPQGETAKSTEVCGQLWQALRLERGGTLVAAGGGCTTDVAGFAAATYMRGIAWAAVPTTLVGQVDAAIGGKTAIDLAGGKNLVGAFHWPARVVCDPDVLDTLPEAEVAAGMAEVVKTGLLAGEPLWELPRAELVRACAAFKAALCLRDPEDRGPRNALNLGHTFAHALEAAAGYEGPSHGEAVALGLLAATRLSVEHLGLDPAVPGEVERALRPAPVHVSRERAWDALQRDKKAVAGRPQLVLLEALGAPRTGVELPEDAVRAALDSLIAG